MIDKLGAQIGWNLPESYRNFLLHHNGGVSERKYLKMPEYDAETTIAICLGIGRPHNNISEVFFERYADLKGKFLPIAYDLEANKILLDRFDGSISYWDTARHFPGSSDDCNNYEVASSFEDLLERLTET